MKIAILGKPFGDDIIPFMQGLFDDLVSRHAEIIIVEYFKTFLENRLDLPENVGTFSRGNDLKGINYVLSIGGDGTLLDTVTYVGSRQIPILGINTGRLGFLATVAFDQIPLALDALFKGHFVIDERTLIRADSDQEIFDGINFGLNEFSIL